MFALFVVLNSFRVLSHFPIILYYVLIRGAFVHPIYKQILQLRITVKRHVYKNNSVSYRRTKLLQIYCISCHKMDHFLNCKKNALRCSRVGLINVIKTRNVSADFRCTCIEIFIRTQSQQL